MSIFQSWFNSGAEGIVVFLISVLAVLFSLSIHEFSHGFAAYKMGDETAKLSGRLNLNPLSHLDPIGALFLLLYRFGWAKPVPVNPNNFKNRKAGMVITSLAGPASNLIVAFIALLILNLFDLSGTFLAASRVGFSSSASALQRIIYVIILLFQNLILINIGLAIFNLLPIPPLDGSKVLGAVLPMHIYFKIMQYERFGFIILIVLINIPFFSAFLSTCMNGIINAYQAVIDLLLFFV